MNSSNLDIVQLKSILQPPNPNRKYNISPSAKSKGFTLLMKLVLLTRKYPELLDHIKNLIDNDKKIINQQNERGWTALHLAARHSRTDSTDETVKILVDANIDINLQTSVGWTALMYAGRYVHTDSTDETVKILIDAGADVNLRNINFTALMLAAKYGKENTVNLLINAGADVNSWNSYFTALMLAAKYGTENTVKLLIDAGANVNLSNTETGDTALIMAAEHNTINTVKLLIDAGADLNFQNIKTGDTALIMAAEYNTENTVKLLIDAGANVNLSNTKTGDTALMIATKYNTINTVKLLIDAGADINLQNQFGYTALMIAAKNDNQNLINILINSGVDFSLQDIYGNTAFILAVMKKSKEETLKIFLDLYATAEISINNNDTVLILSLLTKESSTYKLLIESYYNNYMSKLLQNSNVCNNYIDHFLDFDVLKTKSVILEQILLATKMHAIMKLLINFYIRDIHKAALHIKLKDGNLGSKILKIHFNIKNGGNLDEIYTKLKEDKRIIDYFGIIDGVDLVTKIDSYINYLEK